MRNRSVRQLAAAIRYALLLAAVPAVAVAQSEETARQLDRVEVTGTRIKQVEIEGQAPVQTITREDIDRSGLRSIGDVLQQITAAGSSLNTKFNSSGNFGFPPDGGGVGAGATTVDLRHIGPKRVLVLVDGIRWVNESSASGVGGVVDLNTIPLAIVDRIEVLEDGASSIYGSDAIGGVVNIITRRDFDGAQVSLSHGEYSKGDGELRTAELSFGGRGDRHTFFLSASYNEQKEVASIDREQSSLPVPGTGLAFGSSAIPAGRFIFSDPVSGTVFDLVPNAGVANPVFDRNQTGCSRTDDFHCFTSADRFNYAAYNLLVTPSKRKSLFGQTRFELSDSVTWYFKALYNNRQSVNQAAPEPFFLGNLVPTNFWADTLTWSASNPHNPFGFDLVGGSNLLLIGRRPIEGGARVFAQDVDTTYFATGLEGSFEAGSRLLLWDVNFMSSRNKAEQANYGSYNARRLATALGPIGACNADPACVPLNIVGVGSITPAMLDYIQPVVRDTSSNRLSQFSANLSGDLFDLPAGPLAFAAGVEHRDYKGRYRPDDLTITGEYNGVPSLPTSGSYDVDEYFVELNVPLLAGHALAERLDLSLAGRYSDYSTFGGESTGKIGLRWQVNDQFLLRGTFAEGFRAPNIGELFGSASGFDAVLSDPCSAPVAPALAANCASLGVPASYVQPNPQISILTGGNPNLDPETADSATAGFVWSPAFASGTGWSERMDIEFTWYRHSIEGAVQALDAQTQLNLCASTLSPLFCDGITRNNTGAIQSFENFLSNLGRITTRGYDLHLSWVLPETDFGRFRVNWRNTIVDDYEAIGGDGSRQPQGVGVEVNDSGIPEWTSNLSLDWDYGDFSSRWTVRHQSDLTEDCGDAAGFPVCRDQVNGTNRLGSTTFHDLQVGWKTDWLGETRFTAGVNNVFGKEPPICLSCSLNGYDASNYDIPGGRFWYVRAEVKF
jgi:iron complex outermembrane recepter protein